MEKVQRMGRYVRTDDRVEASRGGMDTLNADQSIVQVNRSRQDRIRATERRESTC